MLAVAMLLACLSSTCQGSRVQLVEGRAQANSEEGQELSRKASDALSRNVSSVKSKLSQSNSGLGMPSPLLGVTRSLGVGLTTALKPRRAIMQNAYSRTPRRAVRRFAPRMAVMTPMWEGGNSNFEAALSQLAPLKEVPELRTTLGKFDSLMSDAIDERDSATAPPLRDEVRSMELPLLDPVPLNSSLRRMMRAYLGQNKEASKYRDQLSTLKRNQPEYQLAGVWEANIQGQHIVVRIVYDGDMLTATTMNGEVTLRADVSESHKGVRQLDYFAGEGMVAGGDFVPGRMYLIDGNTFGFLWSGGGGDDRGEQKRIPYLGGGERGEQVLASAGQEENGGGGTGGGGGGGKHFAVFRRNWLITQNLQSA